MGAVPRARPDRRRPDRGDLTGPALAGFLAGFLAGLPPAPGVDGATVIEAMVGYERVIRWAQAMQLQWVAELAARREDGRTGWARDTTTATVSAAAGAANAGLNRDAEPPLDPPVYDTDYPTLQPKDLDPAEEDPGDLDPKDSGSSVTDLATARCWRPLPPDGLPPLPIPVGPSDQDQPREGSTVS